MSANKVHFLDFKLPSCSECCIVPFGWSPGVSILCSDVSEHSVCSTFLFGVSTTYEDGTECSETSEHKIQTPENHPKGRLQQGVPFSLPAIKSLLAHTKYKLRTYKNNPTSAKIRLRTRDKDSVIRRKVRNIWKKSIETVFGRDCENDLGLVLRNNKEPSALIDGHDVVKCIKFKGLR
jgi:hypothetical protein